jgi:hypothetical protein
MNSLHSRWWGKSHAQLSMIMCTLHKIADGSVHNSALYWKVSDDRSFGSERGGNEAGFREFIVAIGKIECFERSKPRGSMITQDCEQQCLVSSRSNKNMDCLKDGHEKELICWWNFEIFMQSIFWRWEEGGEMTIFAALVPIRKIHSSHLTKVIGWG